MPSLPSHAEMWDFSKQILGNPMEFYDDLIDSSQIQIFMVQNCLLLRGGQENYLQGRVLTFWGGGLINPMLALSTNKWFVSAQIWNLQQEWSNLRLLPELFRIVLETSKLVFKQEWGIKPPNWWFIV